MSLVGLQEQIAFLALLVICAPTSDYQRIWKFPAPSTSIVYLVFILLQPALLERSEAPPEVLR